MKLLILVIFVMIFAITPVFAEQVIFSEGKEYEIVGILEETYSRFTDFTKVQGLTTTGEMFFTFTRGDFEYVMFLDRTGDWQKAELRDKIVEEIEPEPTPEPIIEEPITQTYKPDLIMASSHDFRNYWKDTFNIDVQAFDGRINPKATGFEGRVDGVDVKVLLSLDGNTITTLSGVTESGEWNGEYYVKENITIPGEYMVDVIISYLGETASKSSSMFIIGTTTGSGSINNAPIANAGSDQPTATSPVTLDGTGSSDPDGDAITFSWIQTSGIAGTLSGTATDTATFTTASTGVAVFELTVTDIKGKSSTDSVTITVV